MLLSTLAAPSARAESHLDNPFSGAASYLNPDYSLEVATSIAQQTDATVAAKMRKVAMYPTAVWLDRIAAIQGTDGRKGLAQHLDAALAQQQGGAPITLLLVVYDLPNRDCAALASNGELTIANNGLARYQAEYIDPIAVILNNPKYQGVRIVTVLEPDSLPNLITNTGIPACAEAQSSGAYAKGVQYAIGKLHAIPNVYIYLDIAHSAWLGWDSNLGPAVSLYTQIVQGAGGLSAVDGFITDTANSTPLQEPYLTATQAVGGQPVKSATFYQWNPYIDETDFAAGLYTAFVNAGWPASIGFLVDTSRSGWGGSNRPTGPSASTDLNTFVNQSRIDRRAHRGLWCNVDGAGIGVPPEVSPPGYPSSHLDAFVWVKPPGESDGTSNPALTPHPDPNCDPTHQTVYGVLTGALPGAPIAGAWFPAQFEMLVRNAYPSIPTGAAAPDFALSAAPSSLTVNQGASASGSLTITPTGGFNGPVALSASGLPSGVTATFDPTATATTSSLALAAAASAQTGTFAVTISGTSGSLTHTASLSLTVNSQGAASFALSATPRSLSVDRGSSASATVAVIGAGGFSGSVALTASGLPGGVSALFSPASTASTSTLTFSASQSAVGQTAIVTIAGASGALSQATTLQLTVNAPVASGFTLSAAPSTLGLARGASATSTVTVTVTPGGGFSGSVALSATGLPSGVGATFSPTSTLSSSAMTLTASSSAAVGTFKVTVTGVGGGVSASADVWVTVSPPGGGADAGTGAPDGAQSGVPDGGNASHGSADGGSGSGGAPSPFGCNASGSAGVAMGSLALLTAMGIRRRSARSQRDRLEFEKQSARKSSEGTTS
jgi:cellulose 1,4-beta-cellobiosidase